MKTTKKLFSLFLSLVLVISTFGIVNVNAATGDTRYSKKYLQNGGFEENADSYSWRTDHYVQPAKNTVPYWDTTAYGNSGTNGMFEFFKAGAAHFNQSSTNKVVAEGTVAAELNADEVSTIYQRIETVSGSTYTWGLDHRGRDTTDTMVLFIGPEQYADDGTTAIDPSKPSKKGQDQFVKMTEWLKTQYGVSYPAIGCSQKYTVYSKPFAENGAFQNESTNANENFSMTPTDECTEEWSLWVISSSNNNTSTDETVAVNGWSKYGTNCYNESEDSFNDVIKGEACKLGYDCTYTVPKGQTKTLFAFCSFTVTPNRKSGNSYVYDATFGNLLDDIQFKLYQPFSTTITDGGSGGVEAGNATITSDIQNGNLFFDTVLDGELCTIRTTRLDETDTYEFQGAYVTVYADDGTPVTKFVSIYDGDISRLTKEEKLELSKNYFLVDGTTTEEGSITKTWNYYFNVLVESPVNVHMVYTKAPFVLYDSNGGEPYKFGNDNLIGGNMIGFSNGYQSIEGVDTTDYYKDCVVEKTTDDQGNLCLITKEPGFYKSHAALPNESWQTNVFGVGSRFTGWAINDADGNQVILDGRHTVTYAPNYSTIGNVTFTDNNQTVDRLTLDATHGVTLTAQWQFGYTAQAQTLTDSIAQTYDNTALGGWVEEAFIDDRTNVTNYTENINGDTRVERTDAYGTVGEKIIFKATADSANNYVFDGWYTITDGVETRISTAPSLAITVEEGKSTTYYARFKTKTVPVIFHYTPTGSAEDYDYYDKTDYYRYGKYFQDVIYKQTAVKPTGDSKSVKNWFTSPTERGSEYIFDFSTQITEETHLYAGPSFAYNYYNQFLFAEPWHVDIFGTVKVNGKYVDLKNDPDVTDYNVYTLKGTLGESSPLPSEIIGNSKTVKTGKSVNSDNIIFNQVTNQNQTFRRAGVSYNDFYLFNMKTPVWVVFDFTYKGIKYTSTVKDRSLYNSINTYIAEVNNGYYTSFPPETQAELRASQTTLLNNIKNMYDVMAYSGITEPSEYSDASTVSGLTYDSSTDGTYTFTSTTAIRNIEPWGLKYSFTVDNNTITDFADYGAVVLTDKESVLDENAVTVQDLLDNEASVMYSKSNNNIYSGDNGAIEVYYVDNMFSTDFDKNTYVVFFVKDSNGNYYYSNIVSNSYNSIASQDTSENAKVSKAITSYATALSDYVELLKTAESDNGHVGEV